LRDVSEFRKNALVLFVAIWAQPALRKRLTTASETTYADCPPIKATESHFITLAL